MISATIKNLPVKLISKSILWTTAIYVYDRRAAISYVNYLQSKLSWLIGLQSSIKTLMRTLIISMRAIDEYSCDNKLVVSYYIRNLKSMVW